jgi:hypothetical protein
VTTNREHLAKKLQSLNPSQNPSQSLSQNPNPKLPLNKPAARRRRRNLLAGRSAIAGIKKTHLFEGDFISIR